MNTLFANLEFWHWFTLAALLIILEMFSPGVFFLWLGIAAGCVGIVLLMHPDLTMQSQLILFAVLAIASIVSWRWVRQFFPEQEVEVPNLNRRAEQYVGRTFNLVEPIVNGSGKINVDDSTWRVRGEDAPLDSLVKVTGVDGIVFEVDVIKKAE